jgi:hypothetical protein
MTDQFFLVRDIGTSEGANNIGRSVTLVRDAPSSRLAGGPF